MEDGDEKLELVEEAKADGGEEKGVFDVEYEQNLLEGERERSTGPLDFVLEDVAINGGKEERESERLREREREKIFLIASSSKDPFGE